VIVASMWPGAPPGAATTLKPRPIVPSGFWNAAPVTEARWVAPHWSSVPSSL
jgi:hypothetical protein